MPWWLIWLIATVGTMALKFMATRTVERLRHELGRLQKEQTRTRLEAEEARDACAQLSRQERDRGMGIQRLQRAIAELEHRLEKLNQAGLPDEKGRTRPRSE
jgi:uncharacterized protein HemX